MIDQVKPEIEFPVDCHFKVIAEELNGIQSAIETALMNLGVSSPLPTGNRSAGGKYVTFNVTVRVGSREQMNQIDAELRKIPGVKMVL